MFGFFSISINYHQHRHHARDAKFKVKNVLLVAGFWQPILAPDDCCPIKTVTDAPGEDSHLNGVYTLKSKEASKPDPKCVDGCVYLRDNKEYCFIDKPGPTVVCEVSIHFLINNNDTWVVFCQNSDDNRGMISMNWLKNCHNPHIKCYDTKTHFGQNMLFSCHLTDQ